MVTLVVYYTVRSGAEKQALEYIRKMQAHTRSETGCRLYFGHQSPANPRRFLLYERYEDQVALDSHRAAPYFTEYITNGLAQLTESRTAELFTPMED